MDNLDLDNLSTIETNSRRGGGQNFDLQHDVENQRFTVSDAFYTANNMDDNGFIAHYGNGNAYLSIQPNDDSVSYRGREGFEKSKKYTSTTMSELFEKLDLVGNLALEPVGEKDGDMYFRVESIEDDQETDDVSDDTIDEEVATEDPSPSIEEDAQREQAEATVDASTDNF